MLDILLQAEENLLDSLADSSSNALDSFRKSWSSFYTTLKTVPLDDETVGLAHTTASRVATLAESLLKFHNENQSATVDFKSDLEDLLEHLDIADDGEPVSNSSPVSTLHQPPILKQVQRASYQPPTYIEPAYKWLLKNVHNPYPSKETKELLSRRTATSVQNIDAWFLNARRRIGWTTISKKFFGGSKADTVAAAFRALSDDPKLYANAAESEEDHTPLPGNIQMAFVEMEDAAKGLYSQKFSKSQLASKLDGMLKDMTDNDRERRRMDRGKEKAAEKAKRELERRERQAQEAERRWKEAEEAYPSPSPEPDILKRRFETPSSVDGQDDEDTTPPTPVAGRKRASSEDSTDEREPVNERPAKRSRIFSSSSSCPSVDSLFPSRQDSFELLPSSPSSSACSTPPPSTPSEDSPTSLPQNTATPKRMRRLSDADAEPRPKRPMPLVRPRLQVVSDPLPKSLSSVSISTPSPSQADEFAIFNLSQFLEAPSAAVIDDLETCGPLEFNMFDYSQFADYASNNKTSDGADWETESEHLKGQSFLPLSLSSSPAIHIPSIADFDLQAPVSIIPDFNSDFCATTEWPYAGGIPANSSFCAPISESVKLNDLDGLSSLVSLPTNSQGPSLEDLARTDEITFGSLESIDWSSIIPQTIPPTQPVTPTPFASATITPTTLYPTAYLGSGAESRAEKLRKYQECLGQVKRLQAELAIA
ncbi:A mating type protein [Pleurotus ostreatus PC15]|uniref:A mating type protein n=1 Tax=Pleurotus ostreatus (strain PC15) TaxID=1137138 RepID=A0A067P5D4_PLEO1|nr:A mating type protein [Pleurotus ostreatus PC15]